jgi:transposase
MSKVTRKRYLGELKSCVALKAVRGEQMLAELVPKHSAHKTMIAQWKRHAINGHDEPLFWQDSIESDSQPGRRGKAGCEDRPISGKM